MNIYRTKNGKYINIKRITYIIITHYDKSIEVDINIGKDTITLLGDTAKAFLEYLDKLEGVYAGSA